MKTIRKNIFIPSTLTQSKRVTLSFLIMASLTFFVGSNSNLQFASAHKSSDGARIEFIEQFGTSDADFAQDVFAHSSGVYVVGVTEGTFPDQSGDDIQDQDAFLCKYSTDSDEEWTRQFGTSEADSPMNVSA